MKRALVSLSFVPVSPFVPANEETKRMHLIQEIFTYSRRKINMTSGEQNDEEKEEKEETEEERKRRPT